MKNMQRQTGPLKLIHALVAALVASMACTAAAGAAGCPRKDALNTARVLAVDAATTPRVGLKSFPQTLPLGDHEVVLTFDDGPYPVETPALADMLARLHVPADFFLIGRDALQQPAIARRLAGSGNETGNHSMTHQEMSTLAYDAQRA